MDKNKKGSVKLMISYFSPSRLLFRTLFILTALALCFPVLGPVNAQAADKVVLANGDWEPYQGEKLPQGGPASQIVREAFASQGWDVEFRYMPWARGLSLTQEAQTDGTMLYSYNEERGKNFLFSAPILVLETVVFHRKDKPLAWQNPEDLKGLTLGAVLKYDYGFVTEEAGYTLDRVASNVFNYRKLAAGRIDALMEERLVGLAALESEGFTDTLTYHPKPIKSAPYHLIVSRNHPRAQEIIAAFNQGLEQLKQDGRLEKILQSR